MQPQFIPGSVEAITVTITDPNPLGSTLEYQIENGAWQPYAGAFQISMLDYYLSDIDIEARALAASPGYLDSPKGIGVVDEARLEFTTYNLDLEVGDTFQILDYLIYGSFVLGTHYEFYYEDAETWKLAEYNANLPVTTVTADLLGGNHGPGEYRVWVRYIGDTSDQDKMTVRIGDVPDPYSTILVLDEDGLTKDLANVQAIAAGHGVTAEWLLNEDLMTTVGNPCLRWNEFHAGDIVDLPIGEVGDRGFFALPEATPWRVRDWLDGVIPQADLKGIKDVVPMDDIKLATLIGATIEGVVMVADVSFEYDKVEGDLDGMRLGSFGFKILSVDTAAQTVKVQVEPCAPHLLEPPDIALSAPAFTGAITQIDVTLTDSNTAGTSEVYYHFKAPNSGPFPLLTDFVLYSGSPVTVQATDYPDGFTIYAYCKSIDPAWTDSLIVDDATYSEFFGVPVTGDVLFVIDASSSMNSGFFDTHYSRYDAAVDEVVDAIQSLDPSTTFSVAMFDNGVHWTDGTFAMQLATAVNKQAMIAQIMAVRNDSGTNYQAGLGLPMSFSPLPAQVIFLSDGSPNEDDPYQTQLDALVAAGIKVDTVGLDLDVDDVVPVGVLQAISDATGGTMNLVDD